MHFAAQSLSRGVTLLEAGVMDKDRGVGLFLSGLPCMCQSCLYS